MNKDIKTTIIVHNYLLKKHYTYPSFLLLYPHQKFYIILLCACVVDAISAQRAIILCELNVLRVCGAMAAGRLLLVLYAVFYLLDRELGIIRRRP